MRYILSVLCILTWIATSGASPGLAQTETQPSGGGLLGRLDDFGRAVFSGRGTTKKATPQATQPAQTQSVPTTVTAMDPDGDSPAYVRSGSNVGAAVRREATSPTMTPPASRTAPEQPTAEPPAESRPTEADRASPPSQPGVVVPGVTPVHERLSAFRQSAFGDATPKSEAKPDAADDAQAPTKTEAKTEPKVSSTIESTTTAKDVADPAPTLAPPRSGSVKSEAVATEPIRSSSTATLAPSRPATVRSEGFGAEATRSSTATLGQDSPLRGNPAPAISSEAPPVYIAAREGAPTVAPPRNSGPLTSSVTSELSSSKADRLGPSLPSPKSGAGDSVLFNRQSPVLGVETIGSRRISVGKASTFEVILSNNGQVAADQVVVTVGIPEWTEVTAHDATRGSARVVKQAQSAGQLFWTVGHLEAKGREKLTLRIVPRQSRPFDLAVKWDYSPVASQAVIEVEEPKLALSLHGPREVLYGKSEKYRLEILNSGNGDAENLVVALTPGGVREKQAAATQEFGTLAAGQKKSVDIELTARQSGGLPIHVEVRAQGGIQAQLDEEIVVRRPELKVTVEAPRTYLMGTEATYRIRLVNPGTATVASPQVQAILPPGAKFVSCLRGGKASPDGSKVQWSLDSLPPAGEVGLSLTLTLGTVGVNRLDVQVSGEGDLTASTVAMTEVEAVADLAMSVEDPKGPVALDSEATYQIRVSNRGSAPAERIEVVAYFSNGLEPVAAEGSTNRIAPGQVVFEPIGRLAPGQSVTLSVRAKAEVAGAHIFRLEVHSKPSGARLVNEGTTRFYGEGAGGRASLVRSPKRSAYDNNDSMRTADRREAAPTQPTPPRRFLAPVDR